MKTNLSFLALSAAIFSGLIAAVVAPNQSGARALAAHQAERQALATAAAQIAQASAPVTAQPAATTAQAKKVRTLRIIRATLSDPSLHRIQILIPSH